jgi:hypothetical protein
MKQLMYSAPFYFFSPRSKKISAGIEVNYLLIPKKKMSVFMFGKHALKTAIFTAVRRKKLF